MHKIVCHQRGTSPRSSEPTYLHYITVQYGTVHYTTVHYITVKYSTFHYATVHYITVQYITVHYITYIRPILIYFLLVHSYVIMVLRGGPCRTRFLKNPIPLSKSKKSNIVSNLRRTPDELGLVQGGPTHDEIGLGHPGVSFTSPKSLVPSIYIYNIYIYLFI